jgi:hypothetical protein
MPKFYSTKFEDKHFVSDFAVEILFLCLGNVIFVLQIRDVLTDVLKIMLCNQRETGTSCHMHLLAMEDRKIGRSGCSGYCAQ